MTFPGTYRAIRELALDTLLETSTARDIMRKAGIRLSGTAGLDSGVLSVDLFQEYARVDLVGLNHSQYGSVVSYPTSANELFPATGAGMMRFWDFRDIEWMRLIANITEAGPVGGQMYLTLIQDVGTGNIFPQLSFEGGAPSVPADSVGFHDSGWRRIEWLEQVVPLDGRPAQTLAWLSNPTGVAGTIGVGLCQILIKRS